GATHRRLAAGAGGAPQGEAGRLGIAGLKLVWPGMAGGEPPRPRGRRARLHRSRPGAVAPALPVLGNPGPCPGGGGMTTPTLLASPFRPFFLLAGIQGAILVPLWLGILLGGWPAPALDPLRWHVHEMLFGLGGAAIAGFLLTAMANWTGTRALDGWGLLVLALAWLLGRLGPWLPGGHPLQVAFLDLFFWLGLALYVARVIIASGNRRNGVMVGVMALLFGVNLLIQLDFIGILPGVARLGEALAIDLVVLLMVVVAGRITPAFTANWLERQGGQRAWVRQSPLLDAPAIVAAALMVPVDAWGGDPRIAAAVALLAAVLNPLRLAGWAGRRCLGEPLLWVLQLGYGWIVAALVLKG